MHVVASRPGKAHGVPGLLDHCLANRRERGHQPRRTALRGRRQAHHAADERRRRAAGLEAPASGNADSIRLLHELHAREVAPSGKGVWVGEKLVAEPGLGGRIDDSRADIGMCHYPAGRGVGLGQRHGHFQQLRQRPAESTDIGGNQDLKCSGALELVGEVGSELAAFLELERARS
jgi:hypothetical protein